MWVVGAVSAAPTAGLLRVTWNDDGVEYVRPEHLHRVLAERTNDRAFIVVVPVRHEDGPFLIVVAW